MKILFRICLPVFLVFMMLLLTACQFTVLSQQSQEENAADAQNLVDWPPTRTRYRIDAILDPAQMTLALEETIVFQNTSDVIWERICVRNYADCCLQAGGSGYWTDEEGMPLSFDGNIPAKMFWHPDPYVCGITAAADTKTETSLSFYIDGEDASSVWIDLDAPMEPGEWRELRIDYLTDIPECGQRFGCAQMQYEYLLAQYGAVPEINELCERDAWTFQLGQFYPILCVWEDGDFVRHKWVDTPECFYSDLADYDVRLTLPSSYTVASSGTEAVLKTENNCTMWQLSGENMRDFAIVASNEYGDPLTEVAAGITVRVFCPDSQEGFCRQGEISLQAALNAVTAYTEFYGALPYNTLDICVTKFDSGGMEYPGLVVIEDGDALMLAASHTAKEYAEYMEKTQINTAHEAAHQWFYAVVGNDQYRYPFLDESFAAFSELLYAKQAGASWEEVDDQMEDFINNPGQGSSVKHSAGESCGEGFHPVSVYRYGKIFLYQLMEWLGKDVFFAMMQNWYADQSFAFATTEEFLEYVRSYCEDLAGLESLLGEYFF